MKGARRAFASRANGRLAGIRPPTAAGTARLPGPARRHGLSVAVALDEALAPEVDKLAREIAVSVTGGAVDAARHALACRMAEAMLDVRRVRLAKRPYVAALEADPADDVALKRLERLDRYERRAASRRKFAMRDFAAAIAGIDPALPLRKRQFRIRPPRVSNFGRLT